MGNLPPWTTRRVNLNSIVGTISPTYKGGLISMTLNELITLMNLPIGTSRTNKIQYMKYTSEYIPKLQIHQHSLLTRKVFSWHNLSAHVFFSRTFSNMNHHWIIIKYGSSLDHHQIWIITRSSSKLDHHWIIIITASTISINWCYLSILLVIGISTEPALFHVRCRAILDVSLLLNV